MYILVYGHIHACIYAFHPIYFFLKRFLNFQADLLLLDISWLKNPKWMLYFHSKLQLKCTTPKQSEHPIEPSAQVYHCTDNNEPLSLSPRTRQSLLVASPPQLIIYQQGQSKWTPLPPSTTASLTTLDYLLQQRLFDRTNSNLQWPDTQFWHDFRRK